MLQSLKRKLSKDLHFLLELFQKKRNYGKFVVITRSRTGSNLLISLLNSHQKIEAYGEVFSLLQNKSCKEVYNEIFPEKSSKTTGFKIFYYHPQDSEDKSIWDYLISDKNIKIIHLRRENFLRVHLSKLIADKTDVWVSTSNENKIEDKKVLVDVNLFLKDVEKTNLFIEKTRNQFKDHQYIEITYEELVKDNQKILSNILSFLNLSDCKLNSPLKKQNNEKLEEIILNYDEVYNNLKNSEFEYLLNDE
ncbi:MAG: sulfotransferase [Flavobacterium sp.]|nr:sulfotransferase [Flavobacterium sp.]